MIDIYINKTIPIIEKALEDFFPLTPEYATKVYDAMRYTLFSKAKRIRPLLMLIIADVFKCDKQKILPFAAAIEYVHTSSLILDDLPSMDNATLRRNKPANHLVFGESISILAAIGLLNHAYSIIAKCKNNIGKSKLIKIIEILSDAISIDGLVGGQSVDILSKEKKIKIEILKYIHKCKTASLFIAAADIAAILCNANKRDRRAIINYAELIGMAFQISDDLNDRLLSETELGKDSKKDILSTTYVSYYGVENTEKIINELIEKAKDELSILLYDTSLLVQLAEKLKRKV